jgi:hypothetical protein
MSVVAQPPPAHPHGFLMQPAVGTQPQQSQPSQPVQATTAPSKPNPADPYYGHEYQARLCARFVRHVFLCPSDSNQNPIPGQKATESTVSLARFIAYAFHRTRLPSSVAYHSLLILARLKSRYPSASCAFGHRLFLTAFMISSKVICDDTYSNKVRGLLPHFGGPLTNPPFFRAGLLLDRVFTTSETLISWRER